MFKTNVNDILLVLHLFTRGRWLVQKGQNSVYVSIECPLSYWDGGIWRWPEKGPEIAFIGRLPTSLPTGKFYWQCLSFNFMYFAQISENLILHSVKVDFKIDTMLMSAQLLILLIDHLFSWNINQFPKRFLKCRKII